MFGKLCKYEWRYMLRIFVPMWALVLVLSVINRFTLYAPTDGGLSSTVVNLIFFALIMSIFALSVVSLIVVIQRFYHGLLKDEGYLMFTLPVKSGALINAKGLTAVLLMFLSGIVGIMVFLIIGTQGVLWSDVVEMFRDLGDVSRYYGISGGDWTLMIIWGILATLASMAFSIYHMYTALALGHLAKKHRVGMAVVSYVAINMLLTVINTMLANLVMELGGFEWYSHMLSSINRMPEAVVFGEIAMTVVFGLGTAIFFFVTRQILEKRLNLE